MVYMHSTPYPNLSTMCPPFTNNAMFCFQTYRNQIRGMEVQYKRLVASGEWLAANEHMKSHALFSEELKNLKTLWEPLKDNVLDTLDLLIRWVDPGGCVVWVWSLERIKEIDEKCDWIFIVCWYDANTVHIYFVHMYIRTYMY